MELFRENIQSAPSQGAMDFWEDWESSSQPKVLSKTYPQSLSLPIRIEPQHNTKHNVDYPVLSFFLWVWQTIPLATRHSNNIICTSG